MKGHFTTPSEGEMTHTFSRRSRKLHRQLIPIAAIPLALTSISGALYSTVLAMNIDAPWPGLLISNWARRHYPALVTHASKP
jgi:hypothetical protein